MKKAIAILTCILVFHFYESSAQVLRSFTPRYYNSSVRGSIIFVSNSIISTAGIGTGSPGTGEVAPAGSSVNNNGAGIYIDVDGAPAAVTLVALNSNWKYLANNTRPANWQTNAYSDAAWASGNAQFGYGDGDEATCVPSGGGGTLCNPTGNKYVTTYFRKTINIADPLLYSSFSLGVFRDDGVVVYVNGTEVYRNNMPTGTIAHATLASTAASDDGNTIQSATIPTSAFIAGNNVIAVEIHQNDAASTDLSFDLRLQASPVDPTFNSSTADLNLPTCSNILFAGLYWGASQGTNGTNVAWRTGETNIKLKIPGAGTYATVVSAQSDYHDGTLVAGLPHTGYRCFADITSLVNSTNPNGTYSIANVVGPLGIKNASGGWTIVIAYSNPVLQLRNLTVFDGSAIMNGGDPALHVGVSGFLTPPSGPVSCELGAVVYDGDRVSQDEFSFKQNSNPLVGTYVSQTPNATANSNDMWNSTISYKGTNVTARNPAFKNTLGYDADIIDVPNAGNAVLGNSQTSASIRFSSPSENYFLHCVTTSISIYNPSFAFDKTSVDVNGGTLVPGDILRYQINYNNVGNDSSTNTVILDNIPSGTTFSPGSIKINGVSKTDASADDQAEYDNVNRRVVLRIGTGANATTGGVIGIGVSGNIQFDVVTASSCDVLSCLGSIRNSARINYNGKTSLAILYDSSGVNTSGCITQGPVINTVAGSCFIPKDTLIVNKCNTLSATLPWARYAGYTFYSAKPFITANIYNQYTPVTVSGVYWAYFANGAGCSDTARITVIITGCPDIDDDNDGIPDYVEFNNPVALQDANGNGVPNWNDASYAGYVDYNSDGVNDNFDYGADSDNDGTPNFYDTDFPGFVDINGDGVNDNADKDLDGIINQYDLDSDNDGIPDVTESYGVDTNGDGVIDNYIDTDNDGFSQNVDANNTGVAGSSVGLGAQDFDGDGIPNYLDTDSDNDGIPDLVEVLGADINNDGKVDGFADANGDGLSDNFSLASALLITGPDLSPVNGRADNWPNKNLDRDLRPNAYDMDSDADGIVDVIEAGFIDANLNGVIDGTIGSNGWATDRSSQPALGLRFTDADIHPDYLDIDSDNDGIPDNIEAQPTATYKLPTLTDGDGDGLATIYDNVVGFSGTGIPVYDHDGDGMPDYRDLDTDADGQPDIIEGNDFNLNDIADDNVALTGIDTDGDGLDNRFDSLNSVTVIEGTSYMMGTNGSTTGDATPGSRCTVQKKTPAQIDRDWRYVGNVLPVQFLQLTGLLQINHVLLNWKVIASKEVDRFEIERSIDNRNFIKVGTVSQPVKLNEAQSFAFNDDVSNVSNEIIYYRIKVIGKNGEIQYSNILIMRKQQTKTLLTIMPNPARDYVSITFFAEKESNITIRLLDDIGKTLLMQVQKAAKGNNTIQLQNLSKYSPGVYSLQLFLNEEVVTQKLVLLK